jgi:hypothetical protein
MAKISFNISDVTTKEMEKNINIIRAKFGLPANDIPPDELAQEAFAVYRWLLLETVKGRFVISCTEDLKDFKNISTPNLPLELK